MTRSKTDRGFAVYDELTDRYGATISVQESSLATEPCCWIFCTGGTGTPHLTLDQARRVRDALNVFITENE